MTTSWAQVVAALEQRGRADLSGEELDRLVDAYFWLDRVTDSIAAGRDALAAHERDGNRHGAALAAWRLFYDHWLVGEAVVARGWLDRARTHVDDPEVIAAGWLAIADADVAMADGRGGAAVDHGDHAVAVASLAADPDLAAMALQAAGRARIAVGDTAGGMARLDRAMIKVVGNELTPLFTGWVYCNVIATCHQVADLERATEWSDAALRWCDSLRDGHLYPGLCRVYASELALLRGDWSGARVQAVRACHDLAIHDERYAGAAHYVVGELDRLEGDLDAAEAAYRRAHALGVDPQPGLALVRSARGAPADAVRAVRSSLRSPTQGSLARVTMLAALADLAVDADDTAAIEVVDDGLTDLLASDPGNAVAAIATAARGVAAGWRGDDAAMDHLRRAEDAFRDLGMPLHLGRAQAEVGLLARARGDDLTAEIELAAARERFRELGAHDDLRRLRRRLGVDPARDDGDDAAHPLSPRELEVLRHAAHGATNQTIAQELHLSRHTVARHLGNIYAKLGVGSRTAATTWAHRHGLVTPRDGQD